MSDVIKPTSIQIGSFSDGGRSVKRGHKCCGCCCDVRRAVIVVDIISVVFAFFGMWGIPAATNMNTTTSSSSSANDDDVVDVTDLGMAVPTGFLVASMIASLIGYGCGIYGAVKYNPLWVGIAAFFHLYNILLTFIDDGLFVGFIGAIMPAFFAYPHFVLIAELRVGIMSEENYKNGEEHSCCCV